MAILIVISSDQEWVVARDRFKNVTVERSPYGEWFNTSISAIETPLIFFHGRWGKIAAAASAQWAISSFQPEVLLNLGTCGGFEGEIERGQLILVNRTVVYDIVEQMLDDEDADDYYGSEIDLGWLKSPYPQRVTETLMVSADRDIVPGDIPRLKRDYGAVAGDWESASIAWVARHNDVRCLILRGVSDLVGDEGSEAYGNVAHFEEGSRIVLNELFDHLSEWLERAGIS